MYISNVRTVPDVDAAQPARIRTGPEPGPLDEAGMDDSNAGRQDVIIDRPAMRDARARGELPAFGGPWFGGLEKDVVWVNAVRIIGDATNNRDVTRAEVQGRREAHALFAYLRDHVEGFEVARLQQTAPTIGIRETRRLLGVTTLVGDDIRHAVQPSDSIALGAWPIDVHPADGFVGSHVMYRAAALRNPVSGTAADDHRRADRSRPVHIGRSRSARFGPRRRNLHRDRPRGRHSRRSQRPRGHTSRETSGSPTSSPDCAHRVRSCPPPTSSMPPFTRR